jgi:hypothetical protein
VKTLQVGGESDAHYGLPPTGRDTLSCKVNSDLLIATSAKLSGDSDIVRLNLSAVRNDPRLRKWISCPSRSSLRRDGAEDRLEVRSL